MGCFTEDLRKLFEDVERTRADMHQYQDGLAVPFIKKHPYCAVWIDLGLGKTSVCLTAISDLLSEQAVEHVLVVGPIRVIAVGWPDEIRTWQHTAWMSYTVVRVADDDERLLDAARKARAAAKLDGCSAKEAESFARKAKTALKEKLLLELLNRRTAITLINREAIPWLMAHVKRGFRWDMVVIDESSGFKDHSSERFKAMLFARRTGVVTRLVELTATPATEGLMGLWAQFALIDDGDRLGARITHFRESFFTYNHYARAYKARPGAMEGILKNISDVTLVMKSKDYNPQQEPIVTSVPIKLSDKQRALYEQMEKERVVLLDDGTEIEAKTAADMSNKLLQMASGVLYERVEVEDPETGDLKPRNVVHKLHDHKIEETERIIDAMDGKPLLVAYHYKSSLDRLKKAFPHAVELDKEGKLIKKWNDGKIPVMLVHPQSAGHGLNLQKGGHHILLFDVIWSLELYLQLVGRLARQGQKFQVHVYILTALKTLDEFVVKRIVEKKDAQEAIFLRLKRQIAKLRGNHELAKLYEDEIAAMIDDKPHLLEDMVI